MGEWIMIRLVLHDHCIGRLRFSSFLNAIESGRYVHLPIQHRNYLFHLREKRGSQLLFRCFEMMTKTRMRYLQLKVRQVFICYQSLSLTMNQSTLSRYEIVESLTSPLPRCKGDHRWIMKLCCGKQLYLPLLRSRQAESGQQQLCLFFLQALSHFLYPILLHNPNGYHQLRYYCYERRDQTSLTLLQSET